MKAEGHHFPPGYRAENPVTTEGQGTEVGHFEEGEEMEGEKGDEDIRIGELFQRAELGHPFGYRRDVNLLMDVICDRLSSRLCHRCVRQTSQPTCPRLTPPMSESCQCQQSNGTGTCVGRLIQGREQITQTLSKRCASCNATLCPRAVTQETVSKTSNDRTVQAGDTNIREGLLKARDFHGYSDSDLPITDCRRTRFLKNCSFLEEKFRQGMTEKARTFARKDSQYKPPSRQYHNLHTDNATSFSMSKVDNDNTEKSVYIKGTNPLLDKLKFELQNDKETKHEFAKLYQDTDIPSPLLPFEFETPKRFENRTVGATHHSSATPVDLLRRRFRRNNIGINSSVDSDLESDVKCDEQTNDDDDDGLSFAKRVGNWNQFDSSGEVIWREIAGVPEVPCEETVEVDPIIHRQLLSLIPRAARKKGGRYNALIGFADKMSHEAAAEDTPYKDNPSLWKQTFELPGETQFPHSSTVTVHASIKAQPLDKESTDIEPESSGGVEDRGVQAVLSSYQAQTQTQTHDNLTRDILTSRQKTQTSNIEPLLKTGSLCETGKRYRTVHADVYTQTSKTFQHSNQRLPFSLNTWTQTPQNAPKETNSDQRTTTGSLPSQSHHSSDWSTIDDSDNDDTLPLNPKNTVKFYKQSFKKLNMKLTGDRDTHSSDSDGDVDHRIGRVLESLHIACPDSWSTLQGSSHAPNKSTRARSFQFSHPVLRDVLSLGEPVPSTISENTEEVKAEEIRTPLPPDFLGCYHEFDLAAFFELHHLDVPVSFRKKREKRVNRQSKKNDQRLEQMDVQQEHLELERNNSDQTDERLDYVTSKLPSKPTSVPSSPMKKKPEFHQGALNQFEAKEGTRRLSWRDQGPISRKAKFYETEADIAGETKPSEEKRKMSAAAETGAIRRISLFEELDLNFWK